MADLPCDRSTAKGIRRGFVLACVPGTTNCSTGRYERRESSPGAETMATPPRHVWLPMAATRRRPGAGTARTRRVVSVDVRPGQIWESCDKRDHGRRVKVKEVVRDGDTLYAVVQSPTGYGRKSRIRLDRFRPNSTGYRLVGTSTPPHDPEECR